MYSTYSAFSPARVPSIAFSAKKVPLKNRHFRIDNTGNYHLNTQGMNAINRLCPSIDPVTIPDSDNNGEWRIRKTETGWTFQLYTPQNTEPYEHYPEEHLYHETRTTRPRESMLYLPKAADTTPAPPFNSPIQSN